MYCYKKQGGDLLNINYASIGKRALAFIIDQLIYLALGIGPVILLGLAGIKVSLFVIVLVIAGIDFIQLKLFKGRTIGKIILKTRILDKETLGMPSDIVLIKRILVIRPAMELVGLLNSILSLCYACSGLVIAEKHEQKQSLWDRFAGTIVVDESIKN